MQHNKILSILVVVFFLTTLIGSIYIGYNEFFVTETVNDEEIIGNNISEEELDINSRLVKSLYNKVVLNDNTAYKYFMYESNNYNVSTASLESKLTLAYFNLKNDDFEEVSTPNLPATTMIEGFSYQYNLNTTSNSLVVSFIPYEKLELAYRDLFGNEETIDKSIPIRTDIHNVMYYVYNADLDGYVSYVTEGGGTSGSYLVSHLTRALKSDKTILLYEEVNNYQNNTNELLETTNYVYTFNIDDDGLYTFISRVKE